MGRNAVAVDTLATCLGSVHRSLYQIRLHVLEAMVATVAMGGEWSRWYRPNSALNSELKESSYLNIQYIVNHMLHMFPSDDRQS